jgi:hypothetical protein
MKLAQSFPATGFSGVTIFLLIATVKLQQVFVPIVKFLTVAGQFVSHATAQLATVFFGDFDARTLFFGHESVPPVGILINLIIYQNILIAPVIGFKTDRGLHRCSFVVFIRRMFMATLLNLGYLVVLQENGGYVGGYMVINSLGRPLEFRLSSAVQPNKVQQILYAQTLDPYICGELIGKALVDKAAVPAALILTTCEPALDLRLKLDAPVVWMSDQSREGGLAVGSSGSLVVHPHYPHDVAVVQEILEQVGSLDLREPFTRVRDALGEARKMGVTSRGATAA